MLVKLNEYKGKLRDAGRRISNGDIATATGINLRTIENISRGDIREFRGEYIDAFAAYFAQQLGVPLDEIDLVAPEPITLPLTLNIRPDRHGARVGQRTKDAAIPLPPPATHPPEYTGVVTTVAAETPASPLATRTATTAATLATRQRAALLPPVADGSGGTPGARDVEREAALEERRKLLLEQARERG